MIDQYSESTEEYRRPYHSIDLAELVCPIAEELSQVELLLHTNMFGEDVTVSSLLKQSLQNGGKRIRPAIALLVSRATLPKNTQLSRVHIVSAALGELIHSASLVHDDVIDGAVMRRGKRSINRLANDRSAILLGDLLFAEAAVCLGRISNSTIVEVFARVVGDLCSGEFIQAQNQNSVAVNWDEYITKSVCKTASLFSACCASAAILNGCEQHVVDSMTEYGRTFGICFQIVDDLLDVVGDEPMLGKKPGSDLQSGILTAPAYFAIEQGGARSERLKELIASRSLVSNESLTEAITIIRESGACEKTIALCLRYARSGKMQLAALQPSTYHDHLNLMFDYITGRAETA